MNRNPKNILVVRTDRIGDVVLSLPLATIIKKHYPKCEVTFLLKEYSKALASNHPDIDNIITIEEKGDHIPIKSNVSRIKQFHFDYGIIVYPTFKIALILFLSRIKHRIGTGYRWYSFLFNKKFYEHRQSGNSHELEYNVNLLKNIGINENIDETIVSFKLRAAEKNIQNITNYLSKTSFNPHLSTIIIHPGSGGSAVELPLHKFKALLEILARELRLNIILTGNETEKKICKELSVNNNIINTAGKFSLDDLIAIISKADIVVANSTGPIHIAAALGKQVVGFYPKVKECSPRRWGPYTTKKIIFTPEIDCNNCTIKQCTRLNCMNSISINSVADSIKKILNIN